MIRETLLHMLKITLFSRHIICLVFLLFLAASLDVLSEIGKLPIFWLTDVDFCLEKYLQCIVHMWGCQNPFRCPSFLAKDLSLFEYNIYTCVNMSTSAAVLQRMISVKIYLIFLLHPCVFSQKCMTLNWLVSFHLLSLFYNHHQLMIVVRQWTSNFVEVVGQIES